MGDVRPFEATAWAPAEIPATCRANPILPLSVGTLEFHLSVTDMREDEFLSVVWRNFFTAVAHPTLHDYVLSVDCFLIIPNQDRFRSTAF